MQYVQRTLMALSMTVGLLLVGCGSDAGGDTPEDAMERYMRGWANHDIEQVLAVVKTDDVSEASLKYVAAGQAFHDALVEEYGKREAARFGLDFMAGNPYASSDEQVDARLENMQIEKVEDGNSATVTWEDALETRLVQEGGRWYVDRSNWIIYGGEGVSDEELRQGIEWLNQLTAVLEDNMDQIDAERRTADELLQQLDRDFGLPSGPSASTEPLRGLPYRGGGGNGGGNGGGRTHHP